MRVPRSAATNKVLNCGFVYKDKPAAPPLPAQAKACLCIKGYNEDVRYLETFAPVVCFETVRAALAEAAHSDLELWGANVQNAYILAPLQPGQEVYMNDPEDPKGDTVAHPIGCVRTSTQTNLKTILKALSCQMWSLQKPKRARRWECMPGCA